MRSGLFLAEKKQLDGTVGGAFGALGRNGEALVCIHETMKNVSKINVVSEPLGLKSAALGGDAQTAQGDGRELGEKLKQRSHPDSACNQGAARVRWTLSCSGMLYSVVGTAGLVSFEDRCSVEDP
jgi:hypothetical protein